MSAFPHYPHIDPQKIYEDLLLDMQRSAGGEKTSFRWIVNALPKVKHVVDGEVIQVLVIGGTVCKSALVKNNDGIPEIILEKDVPKPPFSTGESFLQFVTENIDPQVHQVVMNAADTIKPVIEEDVLDGIFLVSTKENKMEGLLGKKLGAEVSRYYAEKFDKKIKVHIANDTVCLLLSGLSQYSWQYIAGAILGTGLNHAIFLDENTVVNMESGGYKRIVQSEPGKMIDAESAEKGEYLIEKETSGGYLYRHFNYWVEKEHINSREIESTAQLDELLTRSQNQEVAELAQEILKYSATFFACETAAVVSFLGRDTTFVTNGSLFWKGQRYKELVEQEIKKLVPQLRVEFVQILQADIIGAAKVIL